MRLNIALLFSNTSRRQIILKNTFWLALAIGLAGAGDFLLTVYVIRKFGATEYGKFAYALSFVSLFSALFDFGIATAMVREFAADRSKERYLSELLSLKVAIGVVGLAVVAAAGFLISSDAVVRRMIIILCVYIILLELVNLFYALFRSRQRMEVEALFRVAYIMCLSALVVGITAVRPSILGLGLAYVGSIAVILVGVIAFVMQTRGFRLALHLSINLHIWYDFAIIGFYLALARAAGDITTNIGTVMLGYLGRLTEIGWYSAAAKVNGMVLFPQSLVAAAVFPALVEARADAPDRFVRYWNAWARTMVVLSLLLSFLVFAEAEVIVTLLYREAFLPAAWTLRILVVAACLIYVQSLYYHALLIFHRQREILFAVVNGAVVNVVLNGILAPRFGLYGVAIAAVIAQMVLVGQYIVLSSKYTLIRPVAPVLMRTMLISVISGIIMNAALSMVPLVRANLFAAVPLGTALYLGLVWTLLRAERLLVDKRGSGVS